MRSPNHGQRTRPNYKARRMYVVDVLREDGVVVVTMDGDARTIIVARDDSDAQVKVELARQGAFSLPINPRSERG